MAENVDLESRVVVCNSTCTSHLQCWDSLGGGTGQEHQLQEQGLDLNSSSDTSYLCAVLKLLILLSIYPLIYKPRGCHRMDVRNKEMLIAYKVLDK